MIFKYIYPVSLHIGFTLSDDGKVYKANKQINALYMDLDTLNKEVGFSTSIDMIFNKIKIEQCLSHKAYILWIFQEKGLTRTLPSLAIHPFLLSVQGEKPMPIPVIKGEERCFYLNPTRFIKVTENSVESLTSWKKACASLPVYMKSWKLHYFQNIHIIPVPKDTVFVQDEGDVLMNLDQHASLPFFQSEINSLQEICELKRMVPSYIEHPGGQNAYPSLSGVKGTPISVDSIPKPCTKGYVEFMRRTNIGYLLYSERIYKWGEHKVLASSNKISILPLSNLFLNSKAKCSFLDTVVVTYR